MDDRRGTPAERGYDQQWYRFRAWWLSAGDIEDIDQRLMEADRRHRCADCGKRCSGVDLQVDHRQAHRGDRALLYDPANLQTLCRACHSRKTAREDGGFRGGKY